MLQNKYVMKVGNAVNVLCNSVENKNCRTAPAVELK